MILMTENTSGSKENIPDAAARGEVTTVCGELTNDRRLISKQLRKMRNVIRIR
jgi:hypothetical protein